jgi:hypothetical protein
MSCKYSIYGNSCGAKFLNKDGFCEKHAKEKCWCGKQAVEGCCHCGQFVCGRPLCEDHTSFCPAHGGERPKPKCEKCGQELLEDSK